MEIGVRIIGALELILSFLLIPYYFLYDLLMPRKRTPSVSSDLCTISATELARRIRIGELTSVEVVETYVARAKCVNPTLNAIVEDRFAQARQDAVKVDKFLAETTKDYKTLEKEMPLLGVPLTVKESCGLEGLSQSGGTLPRVGVKAARDGQAVANLRKAGAIPLCVTNTPELCLCWETFNLVTGRTLNPYNTHRTAGGSSGGEGALLGAAASIIGVGSDIAGSIRVPAAFNGVYGHKPTPGYVPLEGHYPLSPDPDFHKFLVIGPMTRYPEDLTVMLKVMAGEKAAALKLDEKINLKDINVFYKTSAGFSLVAVPVEREIKRKLMQAVHFMKDRHDCNISQSDFYELADSVEISGSVFFEMSGIPNLLEMSTKKSKEEHNIYVETLKSFFGLSEFSYTGMMFMLVLKHNLFIPKSKAPYYRKIRDELRKKFETVLKDNGVFLFPTFPTPAVHHNEIFSKTAGVMYTMLFNVLEMPSTHVPLGLNRQGLPIGIQVVAAPHQDRLCLAVAKALHEKFGGWTPTPIY